MGKKKFGVSMPGTLERSSGKVQRTNVKTLMSAEEQSGSGERAGRMTCAALKLGGSGQALRLRR